MKICTHTNIALDSKNYYSIRRIHGDFPSRLTVDDDDRRIKNKIKYK